MKTTLWTAVVAGVIVAQSAPASAQNAVGRPAAAPAAAGGNIAVLDLSYVFQNHLRFKQMKEDLRIRVEQAEAALKQTRDDLKKLQDQLGEYQTGSADYKRLEQEIAQRSAQLQADVQIRKKEFLEQEARIYYNVYQEILDEVAYFSKNRFDLVLRFNGEPLDRNNLNPQHVLQNLNRAVVYYNPAIDITPHILKALNSRVDTPAGAANSNLRPSVPLPPRR